MVKKKGCCTYIQVCCFLGEKAVVLNIHVQYVYAYVLCAEFEVCLSVLKLFPVAEGQVDLTL